MAEKFDPANLMIATLSAQANKHGVIYTATADAALRTTKLKQQNQKEAADIIALIPEICKKASERGDWCANICKANGHFWATGKNHPNCGSIYYGNTCGSTTIVYDYCIAVFGKLRTFISYQANSGEYHLTVTWADITDEQLKELDKTIDRNGE